MTTDTIPAGATVRICEAAGVREDANGSEHYWNCAGPGTVDVDGTLMCEDHAGEQGYGPKQEEYGFDPYDGLNPTPECFTATARLRHLATALGTARMVLIGLMDLDQMSDAEWAAENYWHGHDDPRRN